MSTTVPTPVCPTCQEHLQSVYYVPAYALNADALNCTRFGDWYCRNTGGANPVAHRRGASMLSYYWNHELPDAAPTPPVVAPISAAALRAQLLSHGCCMEDYGALGEDEVIVVGRQEYVRLLDAYAAAVRREAMGSSVPF